MAARWAAWATAASLSACRGATPGPSGAWTLRGEAVLGVVEADASRGWGSGGARVGLWGPTWGTDGIVPARVEPVQGEDGAWWFRFPLRTGLGAGEAELRVQGRDARLPLGARPGEFEVRLALEEGLPRDEEVDAADAAARAAVAREAEAWAAGAFLLVDPAGAPPPGGAEGCAVVGELRFRGDAAAPLLFLADATWATPGGPVEADRADEGADIVLAFPVEPSLRGEDGMLRVNVPTREAVVPAGPDPVPDDRRLRLEPGALDPERREALARAARERADAAERALLADLLPRLARAAGSPDGACRAPEEVDPAWPLLLEGYEVDVFRDEALGCVVEVAPAVPQHRRRAHLRAGPSGLLP